MSSVIKLKCIFRGLANLSGLLGKGVRGAGGTLRRKEKEV
jgi:hypothetical protein